jgi:hypothetical protein
MIFFVPPKRVNCLVSGTQKLLEGWMKNKGGKKRKSKK